MDPSFNQLQQVLQDNFTVDVFKSIVISLDEIIDLKLDKKMDAKIKEFETTIKTNQVELKKQINTEME